MPIIHLPDNFDMEADLARKRHSEGSDDSSDPATLFAMLALGKTLGKKVVVVTPANTAFAQTAPVDLLELKGDDMAAQSLTLTLQNPRAIRDASISAALAAGQNISGEAENDQWPLTLPPGSFIPPAVAIVEWGVGAGQSRVDVDFLNGMSLMLHASYLRVRAFLDGANVINGGVPFATVLPAFVSPGRPSSNIAQRTLQLATLLFNAAPQNGQGNVFPIPRFAKSIVVTGSAISGGGTANVALQGSIEFFRNTDNGALGPGQMTGSYFVDNSPSGNGPTEHPIPNGSYFVRWRNVPGDPTYEAVFVNGCFRLAL